MADLKTKDEELVDLAHRMRWVGEANHYQIADTLEYYCELGQQKGGSLFFSRGYEKGLCIYCLQPVYQK